MQAEEQNGLNQYDVYRIQKDSSFNNFLQVGMLANMKEHPDVYRDKNFINIQANFHSTRGSESNSRNSEQKTNSNQKTTVNNLLNLSIEKTVQNNSFKKFKIKNNPLLRKIDNKSL